MDIQTGGATLSADANHGIYSKTDRFWWLASPSQTYTGEDCDSACYIVEGVSGVLGKTTIENNGTYPVRPVVCIPTSVFNSNYLSGLVDD